MDFNSNQIDILKDCSVERFDNEVIQHINVTFPFLLNIFNEGLLRKYVKQGISQAKSAGITQRGPVRLYIDTMLILGSQFEHNPLWSDFIYNRGNKESQIEKSMNVYSALQRYNSSVNGKEGLFYKASIDRFQHMTLDYIEKRNDNIHDILNSIHPQKYTFASKKGINDFIQHVEKYSNEYHAGKYEVKAYITIISFLFGCYPSRDFFREGFIINTLVNYITTRDVSYHNSLVRLYSSLQIS